MRRYRGVPDERRLHWSDLTTSVGDVWPEVLILAPLRLLSAATGAEWIWFVGLWSTVSQQRQRAEQRSHGASSGFIASEVLAETKKAIFYTLNEHN